mmetsp:Transcript_111930/g.311611  ORF Transcript_111930/g.311611 Transcript_111930/m.311611 type:complete len:258 (-) Transcript_111930:24-797(-)
MLTCHSFHVHAVGHNIQTPPLPSPTSCESAGNPYFSVAVRSVACHSFHPSSVSQSTQTPPLPSPTTFERRGNTYLFRSPCKSACQSVHSPPSVLQCTHTPPLPSATTFESAGYSYISRSRHKSACHSFHFGPVGHRIQAPTAKRGCCCRTAAGAACGAGLLAAAADAAAGCACPVGCRRAISSATLPPRVAKSSRQSAWPHGKATTGLFVSMQTGHSALTNTRRPHVASQGRRRHTGHEKLISTGARCASRQKGDLA